MSLYNPVPVGYDPTPYAKLHVYVDGTSTLTPVYADAALTDERTNPVIADAAGLFPQIHLDDTVLCRVVITGPDGNTASPLYAADGVGGAARPSSPIDPTTGASYEATLADAGRTKKRTHPAAMTDTLLVAATAGNGYRVRIWNASTTVTLTVNVAGGGTIDTASTIVLQPGQRVWFECDGTEYTADAVALMTGWEEVPFPAGSLVPCTTNGATYSKIEIAGQLFNYDAYLFDASAVKSVNLPLVALPGWNGGQIGVKLAWQRDTAGAGAVGEGVAWGVSGRAIVNFSGMGDAPGTEVTVSDALEIANSIHETAVVYVTLGMASAYTGRVFLQLWIKRKVADASDTLAGDARLVHVSLYYRKTMSTDAP